MNIETKIMNEINKISCYTDIISCLNLINCFFVDGQINDVSRAYLTSILKIKKLIYKK